MNTATTTTAKPVTLNDTQTAVLTHAIDHTQGKVEWFPDTIKGGARKKVIEGLFTRAMIIGSNGDWIVTDAAYEALGRPRPDQTAAEAATPAGKKAARKAAPRKVAKVTDVVKEGDKVWVKLLGFDERGKVRLSMKIVDQATGQEIKAEDQPKADKPTE